MQENKNIKAKIVDDEPMARQLLNGMLNTVCPNVEVLELCSNLPEGVKAIRKLKPNLIFLDCLRIVFFLSTELFNFLSWIFSRSILS